MGDVQLVSQFLQAKVDLHAADDEGRTVLHWTCVNGHYEASRLLVTNGAPTGKLVLRSSTINPFGEDADI